MRRKVPNVCREKSKVSMSTLMSEKMSDVKNFYGWSEHQLEQNVRAHTNEMGGQAEQNKVYKEIYGKKE